LGPDGKPSRRFGFVNPILVDSSERVIAGHGRLDVAKLLKLDKVPTIALVERDVDRMGHADIPVYLTHAAVELQAIEAADRRSRAGFVHAAVTWDGSADMSGSIV
jgi:hypothetical protein